MSEARIEREARADTAGAVVRVRGELDLDSTEQLAAVLSECHGAVLVDLGGVTFMDSSGLGTLIRARNRLGDEGGSLAVERAGRNVRRLFEVTGLTDFLAD